MRLDPDTPLAAAFALADSVLEPELADRPLTDDVTAAAGLLSRFTRLWAESGAGTTVGTDILRGTA
jgi:histidine ammonia-lyase